MSEDNVITLTDATFDEVVNASDVPVVVDLWAEWCGPCKMIAPTLAEIATEQVGVIKIAKLNIDENPQIPQRYGVMSIPTLLVFRNGELDKRVVGAKPKGALIEEFGL
ncbi:MAG: thioredoxin [Acidimicrobiales bacterium]